LTWTIPDRVHRPDGSEGILFRVTFLKILAMDIYLSIIGYWFDLVTGSATVKPRPLDESNGK
jgi:hypothetical protein